MAGVEQRAGTSEKGLHKGRDDAFVAAYKKLGLSEEEKPTFLLHDLRNLDSDLELMLFIATYPEQRKNERKPLALGDTEAELKAYGKSIKQLVSLSSEQINRLPAEYRERREHLQKFFTILSASTRFLDKPFVSVKGKPFVDRSKLKTLLSLQIDLPTLAKAVGIDIKPNDSISFNGAEAIIAFNLFNNARYHGIPGTIAIEKVLKDEIVFTNLSLRPLPKEPKKPGVKGETGNTGYGLAIADLYKKLLGNVEFSISDQKVNNTYRVTTKFRRISSPQGGVDKKERGL